MAVTVKKAAVIGLGLIGGSIAKALRQKAGVECVGAVDECEASLDMAVKDGTLSYASRSLTGWFADCDIIFVCTPVCHVGGIISQIAGICSRGCVVTDVCSTKGEIINYVNSMENAPVFVGGHPMAGTEKSGYEASFPHLFENAYYILTQCSSTTPEAMELVASVVGAMGAIPVQLGAQEHDMVTAGISHVPHVIAAALVNLVRSLDSGSGNMQMLAAGGFRDITRIASSSPGLWQTIVMSNKPEIAGILHRYRELLEQFESNLLSGDRQAVHDFFSSARNYRASLPERRKGVIPAVYEIVVDVVDRPGIIGEIATILGSNGINIKNINVSNSREFEQGCLRITLPEQQSVDTALLLLSSHGYKVFRV